MMLSFLALWVTQPELASDGDEMSSHDDDDDDDDDDEFDEEGSWEVLEQDRRQPCDGNGPYVTDWASDRPLVGAARRLAPALRAFAEEVLALESEQRVLRLPQDLERLVSYVARGDMARDLEDLDLAWVRVDLGYPVSPVLPVPQSGYTRPWRGPLTPEQLLTASDNTRTGHRDYRTQLVSSEIYHCLRDQMRSNWQLMCGRETKTGNACGQRIVYVPTPAGIDDSYGCRFHLTDAERDYVWRLYHHSEVVCPTCRARPGQPCDLTAPGPDYAYSYKGADTHERRLLLAVGADHAPESRTSWRPDYLAE
jgi:hypothetical protein